MNLQQLMSEGYTILNGEITDFSLKIKSNSELVYNVLLRGDGWGCNYGDMNLLAEESAGITLFNLLTTLGVTNTSDLAGKAARIAVKDPNEPVQYIGNIIYDQWFSIIDEEPAQEELTINEDPQVTMEEYLEEKEEEPQEESEEEE